jgi:hypothetical protein
MFLLFFASRFQENSQLKNLLQMYSARSEGVFVLLALRGNAVDDGIAYPQGNSGQANDAL